MLAKGIHGLPPVAHKVEDAIRRVSALVVKGSDKIAAPLISLSSRKAGVDQFFEKVSFWKRPSRGE